MKHEWRKHEKNIYGVKAKPELIEIPKQKFITISGKGNPNGEAFSERVGLLMSIAYGIKMNYKKSVSSDEEITDYTVYPVEGLWTSDSDDYTDKDEYVYTIMVRQPEFITDEMYYSAVEKIKIKKPNELIDEVKFETVEDGLVVQMLHIGSYDSESDSFDIMDELVATEGYIRNSKYHREIYLSDARRTVPQKLKTILRYKIKK